MLSRRSIFKSLALLAGLMLISFFGYIIFAQLVFVGAFDKKITRADIVIQFMQNEKDFADLVGYFNDSLTETKKRIIIFGVGVNGKISLNIYPLEGSIGPENPILGGDNLEFNTQRMDSALSAIGWTNETVQALKNKLDEVDCNWIRTTEVYGYPIEIYSSPRGWNNYSYYVYEYPLSGVLIGIHGRPIADSGFGRHVVIIHSSAL